MLSLNLRDAIQNRGHKNPMAFLVSIGFSYYAATRLLKKEKRSITFYELEKICFELKCTPNDLIGYTPPKRRLTPYGHPLMSLRRYKDGASIAEMVFDLFFGKLKGIVDAITGLTKFAIKRL